MGSSDERIEALERQVVSLRQELDELRRRLPSGRLPDVAPSEFAPRASGEAAFIDPRIAAALQSQRDRDSSNRMAGRPIRPSVSGEALESFVGRYVMVALAALIILMAVGAVIKMAVQRGLLTPEVRLVSGSAAAVMIALAGLYFRRRGDVRYGGALLALALAVIDLLAWGAGPRFHLVSMPVAMSLVDVSSFALAILALHDDSEFLFTIAVGGALSAPFVASEGGGTAATFLLYGFVVLAGTLRGLRNPAWWRAVAACSAGALLYEVAATALPRGSGWYAPYVLSIFPAASAAAVLFAGQEAWKSDLARAYLATGLVGVIAGWDLLGAQPIGIVASVAAGIAAVTYGALAIRNDASHFWRASAILLPGVSLATVYASASGRQVEGSIFAIWSGFAIAGRQLEEFRAERSRSAAHLLAAAALAALAATIWFWDEPLLLVSGLAILAVVFGWVGRDSPSELALAGALLPLAGAVVSSMDQLLSRGAYAYVPFWTRSSASALAAALGIGVTALALSEGSGRSGKIANRPIRIGVLASYLILWGRMELAYAFNADLAAFLLCSYYAACGVASTIAGRRLGVARLRALGLLLAIYAAVKAVAEVTDISSVGLRVAAYAAVGVFLLGAGYLYRDRAGRSQPERTQ